MTMRVTINAAMTLDGKISTATGDSAISSKQDLARVHRLRASSDAIVVGVATVLADDPQLTVRHAKGKNPARIIIDSRGRTPLYSRILKTAGNVRTIVAVTEQAPAKNIEAIKGTGAEVIVAGREQVVDLKSLFSRLAKMGFQKLLVEGGGELNWSILYLDLADELIVTVAPKIAGGRLATTLVEGDGFDTIARGTKLKLSRVERKRTGELVLYYKIHSTF
jgi:2,5-diamino-6-(ribosylamino)-4(3H)-pyrimidinone 5'-phosphate reductase